MDADKEEVTPVDQHSPFRGYALQYKVIEPNAELF
jgi:hypothetical protein